MLEPGPVALGGGQVVAVVDDLDLDDPAVRVCLFGLPGRAALVRLRPHGRVYEHIDQGLYYQLRNRYHLVLKSVAGSPLRTGPEEVRMQEGELWWFDNDQMHEALNDGDEDRIHMIFDLLPRARAAEAFPERAGRAGEAA